MNARWAFCGSDEFVARAGNAIDADRHQRIIGLQRHIDRAVAALADQVETVIEELAEEGHPRVEGLRETDIRRNVRQIGQVGVGDLDLGQRICNRAGSNWGLARMLGFPMRNRNRVCEPGGDRGRVVDALVDDQVGDDAGIGIGDVAGSRIIGVGDEAARSRAVGIERIAIAVIAQAHLEQARHHLVGGAPCFTAGNDVVVGAIHRAEAVRRHRRRHSQGCAGRPGRHHIAILVDPDFRDRRAGGMRLGDLDLLQDEFQVLQIKFEAAHLYSPPADNFTKASRCDIYSISLRSDCAPV